MRISDWSSDVCSSDLRHACRARHGRHLQHPCGDAAVARRAPDDLDDDDCVASWVCLPGCTDAPGTSGEIDQCSITSVPIWRWPSPAAVRRSEEHTSELQSLMRISYAVFCLKKKNK